MPYEPVRMAVPLEKLLKKLIFLNPIYTDGKDFWPTVYQPLRTKNWFV